MRSSANSPLPEPYRLPVSGSLAVARWSTAVAALALLTSAVAGMRFGTQWLYQSDDLLLWQVYGQDAAALLIVLPVLAISMWRARRGSARALMVWAGALIWSAYWYHFFLTAVPFGPLFPVHVALVGSSLFAAAALLARVDVPRLAHRFGPATPARTIGALMVGVGALLAAAWMVDVLGRLRRGEVLDSVSRSVYMADLSVMLPVTIAAGIMLWRRQTWGYVLAGPLLVNAALSILTLCIAAVAGRRAGLMVSSGEVRILWGATLFLGAFAVAYLRTVRA